MTVKRDCGVDLLRFIACCAVVGLHTFTNGLTPISTVVYYACGFASLLYGERRLSPEPGGGAPIPM